MAYKGQFLRSGESLQAGDYLISANGQYTAILQEDANFVLYWGRAPDNLIGAMWASDTARHVDQDHLGDLNAVMQGDGNFVVYLQGASIWASGPMQKNPDHFAIMQDDGNFVLYNGAPDKSGASSYWASDTDRGNIWLKLGGVYVGRAKVRWDGHAVWTRDYYRNDCNTLNWPESGHAMPRNAHLDMYVVNYFDSVSDPPNWSTQLGAVRAKRVYQGESSWNYEAGHRCW